MVALPMRPLAIRDLLSPGTTSSNNIEYPIMLTRTQSAAGVAEGGLKPQSDLTFDLKSAPVRTVAHVFKASRQILDDAPGLQSIIDAEARYGLEFLEDTQFLYGDGTGQNLTGIVPLASAYSQTYVGPGTETDIDRLRLAILQSTLSLYPATGIVLHPTDWAKVEMTKDGQGRYIIGNPQSLLAPTLWGLPVASSLSLTAGTFLTGAFRRGAQIFDRQNIEVLLSTEDQDNFVKNMITIRAEERLALAVYRPTAFVTGALPV
jgi:HK97 family phage major capsid protein